MTNEEFEQQAREEYQSWISEGNLQALEEVFPVGRADDPVLLFEGTSSALTGDGEKSGDLRVELTWSPRPRVCFTLTNVDLRDGSEPEAPIPARLVQASRDHLNAFSAIRIPNLLEPIAVRIESYSISSTTTFAGIVIESVNSASTADTRYVLFQLPNFVRLFPADGILRKSGGGYSGRTVLLALGWKITLDNIDWRADETKERGKWAAFAITHVGRIEKEDGSTFQYSDLLEIRRGLSIYLSFCVGRWTDLARLRGYASDDNCIWNEWRAPSVEPHIGCRCWLDASTSAQFTSPFSNFMRLWTDEYWGRVLNDVIHWYVSANTQSGAIEGSIVLIQNAFELLAAAILVEHYKWIDEDGFGKLNAANKLRLLFRWAGIPTEVPLSLQVLSAHVAKQAKTENREIDGPQIIVWLRNKIVHPTEKNRTGQRNVGNDVSVEVWMLGLWYLEICLLKLIGHVGTYGSRLRHRWVGDVDPMPCEFRNATEFPLRPSPATPL